MHHTPAEAHSEHHRNLLTQLQEEKYLRLEFLNQALHSSILAVQINDTHDSAQPYTSLCLKLHEQVDRYLRKHLLVITPYIGELIKKKEFGHDCETCNGACSIRHTAYISEIQEAHSRINELISCLKEAATEIQELPEGWRILCSNISLLRDALLEFFSFEESTTMPMIVTLQKNIGAHT